MTEITYYLVRFNTLNPKDDFEKMASLLSTVNGVVVTPSGDSGIHISYKDQTHSSQSSFKLISSSISDSSGRQASMVLTTQQADRAVVELFRKLANKFQYRLFSTRLQCFLPSFVNLLDVDSIILNEKATGIFQKKDFRPVFTYDGTNIFFAENISDKSIHILNAPLLEYFLTFGVEEKPTPEFSYQVAPNIVEFVALVDQELIPLPFYEYFGKSMRIVNYSFFDIANIQRKVFIKPFFYEYDAKRQEYVAITSDKSVINFADKVRIGETLHVALTRIVKDDLKLAPDYFRAKVMQRIEFDKDKEGILTPRLWVNIYLKDIHRSAEFIAQSQRSWTSLNNQKSN
ncbi:hypothetical protein HYW55_01045 [Candidatus Gottesmanbacteria bacterium]|nr:hypothetical protein [Candidatus Gottesmanbacteria bacterium]